MAIVTTLGQHCTVYKDETGAQRFQIDSSIDAVLAGDLPLQGSTPYTSNIFVHQILNPVDPKSDKFLRVGNVVDLTTLPLGRETAVGRNETLFLATGFTVVYDDVATASQAKLLIQQRVDNLIADWHTYNDKFIAPLNAPSVPPYTYSDIPFPLTNSIASELKDAYGTAHAQYLVAKAASDLAAALDVTALAAAAAANNAAVSAVSESQACSSLLGQLNQAKAAIDAYRIQVNLFHAAAAVFGVAAALYRTYPTPTGPQQATFDGAKLAFDTAVGAMTSAVLAEALLGDPVLTAVHSTLASTCSAKIGAVAAASAAKLVADSAAATAATTKTAANTALASAVLADDATFLAAQALCPDLARTVP